MEKMMNFYGIRRAKSEAEFSRDEKNGKHNVNAELNSADVDTTRKNSDKIDDGIYILLIYSIQLNCKYK